MTKYTQSRPGRPSSHCQELKGALHSKAQFNYNNIRSINHKNTPSLGYENVDRGQVFTVLSWCYLFETHMDELLY